MQFVFVRRGAVARTLVTLVCALACGAPDPDLDLDLGDASSNGTFDAPFDDAGEETALDAAPEDAPSSSFDAGSASHDASSASFDAGLDASTGTAHDAGVDGGSGDAGSMRHDAGTGGGGAGWIGPDLGDLCGGASGLSPGAPWPTQAGCGSRRNFTPASIPPLRSAWALHIPLLRDAPAAIGSDGSLYVAADRLRAYARDGSPLWVSPDVEGPGPPTIGADGTIYVSTGRLAAIWPDGRLRWRYTPPDTGSGGGEPLSVAIAPDGTVYYAHDYRLHAVRSDGTLAWSAPISAAYGAPVLGSDGTVYVAGQTAIDAFRPDGVGRWRIDGAIWERPRPGSPVLSADESLLFVVATGRVLAYDTRTGVRRWMSAVYTDVRSPIALASDGSVVVSTPTTLLRLTPHDGRELLSVPTRVSRLATAAAGTILTLELDAAARETLVVRHLDGTTIRSQTLASYYDRTPDSRDFAIASDGAVYVTAVSSTSGMFVAFQP